MFSSRANWFPPSQIRSRHFGEKLSSSARWGKLRRLPWEEVALAQRWFIWHSLWCYRNGRQIGNIFALLAICFDAKFLFFYYSAKFRFFFYIRPNIRFFLLGLHTSFQFWTYFRRKIVPSAYIRKYTVYIFKLGAVILSIIM